MWSVWLWGDVLLTLTGSQLVGQLVSQLVGQLVFQLVVAIGFGWQRGLGGVLLLQAFQAALRLPGWVERADELVDRWRSVDI